MSDEKDNDIAYLSPHDILREKNYLDYNNSNSLEITKGSQSALKSSPIATSAEKKGLSHSTDIASNSIFFGRRSPRALRSDLEPSFNYNLDPTTPHYALQVALKNMKERYQKLQKKIGHMEEENTRLIDGKSELFGEIGKMQENSIKLREKNLQLNHEIHSKHKECCSLKEKFTQLFEENLRLSSQLSLSNQEKKKLLKQIEELNAGSAHLRESFAKVLSLWKGSSGVNGDLVSHLDAILHRSASASALNESKTKILPPPDDLQSLDDEFGHLSGNEAHCSDSKSKSDDSSLICIEKAKENASLVLSLLQDQKKKLLSFSPFFQSLKQRNSGLVNDGDEFAEGEVSPYSRLATFGSVAHSGLSMSRDLSPILNNSGGETNILIEGRRADSDGTKSPFDWRKIQISDDEVPLDAPKPSTRTVSTSPDCAFIYSSRHHSGSYADSEGGEDEDGDERTCPMCKATFPSFVPQETFESHVVSHFEVENGFEVVT